MVDKVLAYKAYQAYEAFEAYWAYRAYELENRSAATIPSRSTCFATIFYQRNKNKIPKENYFCAICDPFISPYKHNSIHISIIFA